MPTRPRVLLVDNYDSFTYNLAHGLGRLGVHVDVARNDAFDLDELQDDPPDGIVISPGPGGPADAGLSCAVIEALAGQVPLLGVCLGHQCIAEVYGAAVVRASELVHGKTSLITHDGSGVFSGLRSPFPATRYHSLIVDEASLPRDLLVTARTSNGLVMGVRHAELPVEGVQFHPESILTQAGQDLLANFVHTLPAAVPAPAA